MTDETDAREARLTQALKRISSMVPKVDPKSIPVVGSKLPVEQLTEVQRQAIAAQKKIYRLLGDLYAKKGRSSE